MLRAVYKWGRASGCVWIEDLDTGASVTNDVERVLADLGQLGVDHDAQPIVYRDSTGRWDRIETKRGLFAGFSPLASLTREEAIATAMLPRYRCPFCGAVSFNPGDLEHGYCGRCKRWKDGP